MMLKRLELQLERLTWLVVKDIMMTWNYPVLIFMLFYSVVLTAPEPLFSYRFVMAFACFGVAHSFKKGQIKRNDLFNLLLLPLTKQVVVLARICSTWLYQLLAIVLCLPAGLFRIRNYGLAELGLDATMAGFGLLLLMLALFNFFFINIYYRKNGISNTALFTALFAVGGYIYATNLLNSSLLPWLNSGDAKVQVAL